MFTKHGLVLTSALALLLSGCATRTTGQSKGTRITKAPASKLIARETLFGNPDRASPRISPDGERISFLAPVNGVLNVWVGPLNNPGEAHPVTNDTKRGVRRYFWAYTNQHIIYLQDKGGDENWRAYSVDIGTRKTIDLTPIDKVAAQIQEVSHKFPGKILIGINDRNPKFHDVYRVNIRTGERTIIRENNEFAGYLSDDDFNIRLAIRSTPDGGQEIMEPDGPNGWKTFTKIPMADALTTQPIDFDKTGDILYMIDSRGRNTAALARIDLATGQQTILGQNDRADISDLMIHPTEKTIEAYAVTYERTDWTVLDKKIRKDFRFLKTVADGDFEVISRTLDDSKWIVVYTMDNGPARYYRYDRNARDAKFLFTNNQALERLTLAKMHPIIIKSRDRRNLVSYLTIPATESAKSWRPARPLPMVLFVHGGPWARDTWGYSSRHQWLANRGYAVLSVNYRGSTGFGKDFINASNMEWAGKMHDDLIDAVNWAIKEGVADADRIAIMGGSYGGYATLVGLTFTPNVFACGVDIVGPSNLITLLNTIPPYWTPMIELFTSRIGDHRTEEGRSLLRERSPLTFVDRINKPLLIGQGANDPRVKQAESDQIVEAMKRKNIPVTYVLFPDEGHGFARPENRMSFNAVAEAFLAQHLGGRFEPIGKDFNGSSISVPAGVDQVPGLSVSIATPRN